MDIYFCDLCGIRVTDIDLKGGRAIKRSVDVICATCLELGHGKEWLAKHKAQASSGIRASAPAPAMAAVGAAVASASASASASSAASAVAASPAPPRSGRGSPVLDRARDRARTLDDDQPAAPAAVAPQVVLAEENIVEPVLGEHPQGPTALAGGADEAPSSRPPSTTVVRVPASAPMSAPLPVPQSAPQPASPAAAAPQNLANAASAFSALTAMAKTDSPLSEDDVDFDGIQDAVPVEAAAEVPAGQAPAVPGDIRVNDTTQLGVSVIPEDKASPAERTAGKDETVPSGQAPSKAKGEAPVGPPGSARRPATGEASAGASRKAASKSSTGTAKHPSAKISKSKNKIPRSGQRGQNNRAVLIVSCVTVPIMLLLIVMTMHHKTQTEAVVAPAKQAALVLSSDIVQGIKEANEAAISALRAQPPTVDGLDGAMAKIVEVSKRIPDFERSSQSAGYSEDQIDQAMKDAQFPDMLSKRKLLLDARGKILGDR